MKLLITGTSGFIGSYLADYFLNKDYEVWGLSRNKTKKAEHQNFHWIGADLSKETISLPSVDACVHAAALSPAQGIITIEYIQNNVVGTQNLIRSLQTENTCRQFIFLSGVSVYGRVQESVVNEETLPVDPDPYGISKLLCERLLMEQVEIPVTVLRLPGVLGPGSTNPWLVKQIHKALKNEDIQAYNPESLFNNAVWVEDLTKFIHSLLTKSELPTKDILLLGANQPIKIKRLLEKILVETKSKSVLTIKEWNQSFLLNWDKARSFKYSPRTTEQMLLAQITYERRKKDALN